MSKMKGQAVLIPQPYLIRQSLPACSGCGAIHPLARKPKLDVDNCPDCGTPLEKGEEIYEEGVLGGFWGGIANMFFGAARWLVAQAKRIAG